MKDKYIRTNEKIWKTLKIKAAETDTSIKALAENYILQGLKKEEEKEMLKSIKISVNHPQQHIEKNQDWQDYPCINIENGKKLKHTLGHYFDNWEEYLEKGHDTNYETK